jgi:hypothetical protein
MIGKDKSDLVKEVDEQVVKKFVEDNAVARF